jgi:hypothetical protein
MTTNTKPIEFSVDGVTLFTDEKVLTPIQILALAGIDSNNFYLVQINGKNQESFKDRPNESIHMHVKIVFVSAAKGSMSVS